MSPLAALFIALFAICLVLVAVGVSFQVLGIILGLLFKLAPLILVALVIWFFVKGGSVDIHLPEDWKRKK